jgi:hypothetical protein
MKQVIALVAVLAMGVAASFAFAAPPPGKGHDTTSSSTSTSPGKSGDHGKGDKAKCRPVNLKGTVSGGTIALTVSKASGPKGKALVGTTANLTVSGNVSVQAWDCSAPGSTAATQLKLRQLHVGGSPQAPTTTTP